MAKIESIDANTAHVVLPANIEYCLHCLSALKNDVRLNPPQQHSPHHHPPVFPYRIQPYSITESIFCLSIPPISGNEQKGPHIIPMRSPFFIFYTANPFPFSQANDIREIMLPVSCYRGGWHDMIVAKQQTGFSRKED